MSDFTIHEGEDIKIRVTLTDPNSELGSMGDVTEIVWTACDDVGGVPAFTPKTLTGGGVTIESGVNRIIVIQILKEDTEGIIGTLWRETRITNDGNDIVTRFLPGQNGSFTILESDTL